jgi:hypothetical protein
VELPSGKVIAYVFGNATVRSICKSGHADFPPRIVKRR